MIRVIGRRLIIPRGDTGTFTVPVNSSMTNSDVAVFAILDPLTRKNVLELTGTLDDDKLTFTFTRANTIDIEPRKYLWDITIYHGPIYDEDNKLIDGAEINSYYSAYSLPICEIREVTQNV